MAVPVQTEPTFAVERPKTLFEGQYLAQRGYGSPNYDVAPDGSRFLMIKPVEDTSVAELRVVLNWLEELKRRVPVN